MSRRRIQSTTGSPSTPAVRPVTSPAAAACADRPTVTQLCSFQDNAEEECAANGLVGGNEQTMQQSNALSSLEIDQGSMDTVKIAVHIFAIEFSMPVSDEIEILSATELYLADKLRRSSSHFLGLQLSKPDVEWKGDNGNSNISRGRKRGRDDDKGIHRTLLGTDTFVLNVHGIAIFTADVDGVSELTVNELVYQALVREKEVFGDYISLTLGYDAPIIHGVTLYLGPNPFGRTVGSENEDNGQLSERMIPLFSIAVRLNVDDVDCSDLISATESYLGWKLFSENSTFMRVELVSDNSSILGEEKGKMGIQENNLSISLHGIAVYGTGQEQITQSEVNEVIYNALVVQKDEFAEYIAFSLGRGAAADLELHFDKNDLLTNGSFTSRGPNKPSTILSPRNKLFSGSVRQVPITPIPTTPPTPLPSPLPTPLPSPLPTPFPTLFPSSFPTESPTSLPSQSPTSFPTTPLPSLFPSHAPSFTGIPSLIPTLSPSNSPVPSAIPTLMPSQTLIPSTQPSLRPSLTLAPSVFPSVRPSHSVEPTHVASTLPSVSTSPSSRPSPIPSFSARPSVDPSGSPSVSSIPSLLPSSKPSITGLPSSLPSVNPTVSSNPSSKPSRIPTTSQSPSKDPSLAPSYSSFPTSLPSIVPSHSQVPTIGPSVHPSVSAQPSLKPSNKPTFSSHPSHEPSSFPSATPGPTFLPSLAPSATLIPTIVISSSPSFSPAPSALPSLIPSISDGPSPVPSVVPSPFSFLCDYSCCSDKRGNPVELPDGTFLPCYRALTIYKGLQSFSWTDKQCEAVRSGIETALGAACACKSSVDTIESSQASSTGLKVAVSFMTIFATAAVAFAGFLWYKRKKETRMAFTVTTDPNNEEFHETTSDGLHEDSGKVGYDDLDAMSDFEETQDEYQGLLGHFHKDERPDDLPVQRPFHLLQTSDSVAVSFVESDDSMEQEGKSRSKSKSPVASEHSESFEGSFDEEMSKNSKFYDEESQEQVLSSKDETAQYDESDDDHEGKVQGGIQEEFAQIRIDDSLQLNNPPHHACPMTTISESGEESAIEDSISDVRPAGGKVVSVEEQVILAETSGQEHPLSERPTSLSLENQGLKHSHSHSQRNIEAAESSQENDHFLRDSFSRGSELHRDSVVSRGSGSQHARSTHVVHSNAQSLQRESQQSPFEMLVSKHLSSASGSQGSSSLGEPQQPLRSAPNFDDVDPSMNSFDDSGYSGYDNEDGDGRGSSQYNGSFRSDTERESSLDDYDIDYRGRNQRPEYDRHQQSSFSTSLHTRGRSSVGSRKHHGQEGLEDRSPLQNARAHSPTREGSSLHRRSNQQNHSDYDAEHSHRGGHHDGDAKERSAHGGHRSPTHQHVHREQGRPITPPHQPPRSSPYHGCETYGSRNR